MKKSQLVVRHLIAVLITAVIAGIGFYTTLPVLNPHSMDFWTALISITIVFAVIDLIATKMGSRVMEEVRDREHKFRAMKHPAFALPVIVLVAAALVIGLGTLSSLPIFQSKNLSQMITVEPENIDQYDVEIEDVPLMDKATATLLSQRKMGGLTDLVSQFSVDNNNQNNIDGKPVRVAPLKYNGFFKWFANRSEGIVGYITIDMITQNTELVRVPDGIKYSNSAYFNDNLTRHLRFAAPTKILGESVFELDENEHPYWITAYYTFKAGWFGGRDVAGILICDAVTGEVENYKVGEIPDWVDRVYPADLILQQYDYYGAYQNGYWNSIINQIGVVQTSRGYNYIAIGNDIYVYSGVTSIAEDQSNIGFIFVNQRTKETIQYTQAGAEEYSAAASAEGQVQHLDYKATFPLLVNLDGEPTYYMALKDDAGLVKMYGLVNVEKYQYVSVQPTLDKCIAEYRKLLNLDAEPEKEPEETKTVSGVISDIRTAMLEGTTWYYIQLEGKETYYKASAAEFEDLIFTDVGGKVRLTYVVSEEGHPQMTAFELK